MGRLWRELRTTGRSLWRAPSFTVVALVTLALGIGANASLFSVADVLVLRPLPYPEPEELVAVWLDAGGAAGSVRAPLGPVDLEALDAEPSLFQAVAGWAAWSPTLSERAGLTVIRAATVTEGMLGRVLGVQPVRGRTFRPEEHLPDGTRTVIIADRFWAEHFARDPGVLGRAVSLDDVPYTVVGVMPASFRAPFAPEAEVWTPVVNGAGPSRLEVVARLAPGVSIGLARERAVVAGERAAESWPGALMGATLALEDLRADLLGAAPAGIRLLLLAFGFVLLASCGNASALLLARGAARDREFRVRRALGAERSVIARHFLLESILLGLGGAALGLVMATWATEALVALAPVDTRLFATPGMSRRVLGYTLAVSVGAGLLVGFFAATRASGDELVPGRRRQAARRQDLVRVAFIGAQVACAASLLTGATLMGRSVDALETADLGFETEDRYLVEFDPPAGRLPTLDGALAYVQEVEQRLGRLPGALAVGAASAAPLGEEGRGVQYRVEGEEEQPLSGLHAADLRAVTPGYFYATGMRILDGRHFDPRDDVSGMPVAVVSEALARESMGWPRASPVGRRIVVPGDPQPGWRSVVGVVSDTRARGPRGAVEPRIYLPAGQAPVRAMTLVAHVDGRPEDVLAAIGRAASRPDDPVAPARIAPLRSLLLESARTERFVARLLLALAALTLSLASVGVYGLVGQRVSARRRDLGVRRAVGATAEDLRALVTRRAARLTALGAIVGGAAGIALTDFLDALLFEVPRLDPLSMALATSVLLVVALSAAWLPARRAERIDPMRVLREE